MSIEVGFLILFWGIALLSRKKKKEKLIFGSTPLINNKYWVEALRRGYPEALTLMSAYYEIYGRDSFDLYFEDCLPHIFKSQVLPLKIKKFLRYIERHFAFIWVLWHAKVLHTSFEGFAFQQSFFWRLEPLFLKLARVKIIIIPYGADAFIYSQVRDFSVHHGLLSSYPKAARQENFIKARIRMWERHADCMVSGTQLDGIGRWDVTPTQIVSVDIAAFPCEEHLYSNADGLHTAVKIVHSPNHRGFKGTEFLIQAVEELKQEGLKIDFILLEKVPNKIVLETLVKADILAEQFIAHIYALNGIEGMALGLPVLANMDEKNFRHILTRYSYFNECPVLSTPPEQIKEHLRILIRNPQLREELGRAGRAYAEKYHSYETARYLFGSIYDKILHGKDVDLMNLFHPLLSPYNKSKPFIQHPLIDGKLPKHYYEENKRVA